MMMKLTFIVPVSHKKLRDEDRISLIEGTADVLGLDYEDIEYNEEVIE